MSTSPLQNAAILVSHFGHAKSARVILRHHADIKGWCDETFRARWDGAAALLAWWHTLEPALRPPLADLSADDARAFLNYLESMDLARSTLKGYRIGAAALTCALRACLEHPVSFDPTYAPFKDVLLTPSKPVILPASSIDLSGVDAPVPRARLELLLALMALGMSVPEVCSRVWKDLNASQRLLVGYRHRTIVLGTKAVSALEALEKLKPRLYGAQRLLGWRPATARKWLDEVLVEV